MGNEQSAFNFFQYYNIIVISYLKEINTQLSLYTFFSDYVFLYLSFPPLFWFRTKGELKVNFAEILF